MASNSKISSSAKSELKLFKKAMPKNMAFATHGRFTVLVQIMSNCVLVSTALASPDEKKIRRKVGEFHAMSRMNGGYYAVLPLPYYVGLNDASADYVAECICDNLA